MKSKAALPLCLLLLAAPLPGTKACAPPFPPTFTLPDSRQDKTELLHHLVGALAKSDPGLAVRLACAADPQQPIIPSAGIEKAIFRWTSAEPDEAVEWFKDWSNAHPENSSTLSGTIDRRQVIDSLLSIGGPRTQVTTDPAPGRIMETVDLLPGERRIIAESHAQRVLDSLYNHHPKPDRIEVETAARDWLKTHLPEAAEEIFANCKFISVERERREMGNSIRDLAGRDVIRDGDILQELDRRDFSEFPELLPQALEQARKIKDPAKRTETILRLETSGKPTPAKP